MFIPFTSAKLIEEEKAVYHINFKNLTDCRMIIAYDINFKILEPPGFSG